MLFLSHSLVPTSPDHSQYRREILGWLWCRYGSKNFKESEALKSLVKWFSVALLGRHPAHHEVAEWERVMGDMMKEPIAKGG
jgi:hypothetical protein